MEAIVFIVFIAMIYYWMVTQTQMILRTLQIEQQRRKLTTTDELSTLYDLDKIWDRLGDEPMYGDESDQGAVDVAIYIQDLKWHLEDHNSPQKQQELEQKLQQAYQFLFEVTLVAAGPPPDYSLYEDEDEPAAASNIIDFAHHQPSERKL